MSDVANARRGEAPKETSDVYSVKNDKVEFTLDTPQWSHYTVSLAPGADIEFYGRSSEQISITVKSISPDLDYTVSGHIFNEKAGEFDALLTPIEEEYRTLKATENATSEQLESLIDRYNAVAASYIEKNLDSPVAPYALMAYDGDDFLKYFNALSPEAKDSPYYELSARKAERIKAAEEKDRLRRQLIESAQDAPSFTLKDLEGKPVSLSDFRGKYVVIDFWGSWCIWCIKGFPALKATYEQYSGPDFEVIGVDCRDSDEAWRAAVKKYELPWVNVYNPEDSDILQRYAVSGFPTKVIVNPEGKIVDITVGEDPSFFERLAGFLKK